MIRLSPGLSAVPSPPFTLLSPSKSAYIISPADQLLPIALWLALAK